MADFKDKVKGMMLGVAVGDALGQPYEMKPPLGRPVSSFPATGGQTTDDWQMSAVVAESLMRAGKLEMGDMVKGHVAAYETTIRGWGGAHRDACKALKEGVSPEESGKRVLRDDKPYRGRGNGMCMKIGPLAAFGVARGKTVIDCADEYIAMAKMTHPTSLGLSSAIGMAEAVAYCLRTTPDKFDTNKFLHAVKHAVGIAEQIVRDDPHAELMSSRLHHLCDNWDVLSVEEVIEQYKGGGYVFESLPFSLALFCKGSHDIACVYDCVGAGGDTDTNASMVGALAGALHGSAIFPQTLLYKLLAFADIDRISSQFSEWCATLKS